MVTDPPEFLAELRRDCLAKWNLIFAKASIVLWTHKRQPNGKWQLYIGRRCYKWATVISFGSSVDEKRL